MYPQAKFNRDRQATDGKCRQLCENLPDGWEVLRSLPDSLWQEVVSPLAIGNPKRKDPKWNRCRTRLIGTARTFSQGGHAQTGAKSG